MKAAARAFLVLFSAVALFGCGRKPVTYDLTITNPFADVSGVTATIEVESGKTEVPISGATKTIPVVVPEIKESDAMQQLLLVTLHAPLPCGKTDLLLDTRWASPKEDIARMEKKEHPLVGAVPEAPPKRCDGK
jgi:hypothetical protein